MDDDDKDGYLREYLPKLELVKDVETPRLIFIGGSNLAFGLDSRKISRAVNKNVVNFGLHAGLGMKLIINDIDEYLKEGDIVVFCPEYNHFFGEADGDNKNVIGLFRIRPQIILKCSMKQLGYIMKGVPKIVTGRLFNLCMKSIGKGNGNTVPKNTGTYRYCMSGFNEYGDEVSHLMLKSDNENIKYKALDGAFDESFYRYFIKKIEKWERHEISVIMMPPAIYDKEFNVNRTKISHLTRRLSESGHPFRARPECFSYPRTMMYNTSYHVNKKGMETRVNTVIQILADL